MARKPSSGKLTNRQRERIRQARQARLHQSALASVPSVEGELGSTEEGLIAANFGPWCEVLSLSGEIFRCAIRETVGGNPVCGDRVSFRRVEGGKDGVVTAIFPRRTTLTRPGPYNRTLVTAANIDQVIICATAQEANPGLIDRYLVAASVAGLRPVIVINKCDRPFDQDRLAEQLSAYEELEYPLCFISAKTGEGCEDLVLELGERVSILAGPSGVGKSAIARQLLSDEGILVGDVHGSTGQGRHTTTVARYYPLAGGGALIDSPGVRHFALSGVRAADVPIHFPEIAPLLGGCKFSDCNHIDEPGCAVLMALEGGEIDERRLVSLWRIMDSLEEVEAEEY